MMKSATLAITLDTRIELDELTARLESAGYVRAELVDGVGQYAVRGGIVDIFPPYSEFPVRIELFDDEIDQMGLFDIMTQRRIENISGVTITPAREILADAEARQAIKKAASGQLKKMPEERVRGELAAEIEAIDGGVELNYIDKYISLVYERKTTLADYAMEAAATTELRWPIVFVQEENACADRMKVYDFHISSEVESLLEKGEISSRYAEYARHLDYFEAFVDRTII